MNQIEREETNPENFNVINVTHQITKKFIDVPNELTTMFPYIHQLVYSISLVYPTVLDPSKHNGNFIGSFAVIKEIKKV